MSKNSLFAVTIVVVVVLGGVAYFLYSALGPKPPPPVMERLDTIGPTVISNQTSYPLTVYGGGFRNGDVVSFEGPFTAAIPATFIDGSHLTLRLPPQKLNPLTDSMQARVSVRHADGTRLPGNATITVVNDADFAEPYTCALTPDGSALFVASPTTDEIYRYNTDSGQHEVIHAGDGPRALAMSADGSQLVAADEYESALELISTSKPSVSKKIPLGEWPEDVTLDGQNAWVTTRQGHVMRVDLAKGVVGQAAVPGRQPRSIIQGGNQLFVAQIGTDDVVASAPSIKENGAFELPTPKRIAPGPGVKIVGGRTAKYGAYVMSGKAARALVYDPSHELVFASTIGPNIGPNPDKVEVSMNGGVEVIDAKTDQVLLHKGMGAGVLEGLAIDPAKNRLYAADIALGRVLAFDTAALRDDPEHALVGELYIQPPAGTPHIRPDGDFETNHRASTAIHSGPRALCLDAKKQRLYAVNRLSGTVSVLDVQDPSHLALAATFEGPKMWNQKERRLGDILFFTDLGRSGMSCDACHMEGHTSGILYEKTHPLRIYRVTTLRGIRDSAPYFTPSALPTLSVVAKDVLSRNRFHNPDPSPDEIHELADYQALFAPPPNPFVATDGAFSQKLTLPDGQVGDAVHGMKIFESKEVGCSSRLCHPRPTFSADQDPQTRAHFDDVGTPVLLPLHPEWQEPIWGGWPPPPLAGTWDVFPLLESGAGGLGVEGGSVVPTAPFALRTVLDMKGSKPHGNTAALTAQDKNDLLAYLMSL